jgi:hypothetical protein
MSICLFPLPKPSVRERPSIGRRDDHPDIASAASGAPERELSPGRGEIFPKPVREGVEVEPDVVVARQATMP